MRPRTQDAQTEYYEVFSNKDNLRQDKLCFPSLILATGQEASRESSGYNIDKLGATRKARVFGS